MDTQMTTYAQAGVDIEEGAAAVDAIKDAVHSTYRPEVIGDIGGFGGLFSAAAFKDMEDPIMISKPSSAAWPRAAVRPAARSSAARWQSIPV